MSEKFSDYTAPIEYTNTQIEEMAKTERKWVGGPVESTLKFLIQPDHKVLDYGCGENYSMLNRVIESGYLDSHGYDIKLRQTHNKLLFKYDIVTASNVLNIQPTEEHMMSVLQQMAILSEQYMIFNYTTSPRRLYLTNARFTHMVQNLLISEFKLLFLRHNGVLVIAEREKWSYQKLRHNRISIRKRSKDQVKGHEV